jgi:hypothetical protein
LATGVQVEQWGSKLDDDVYGIAVAPLGEVIAVGVSSGSVDGQPFVGNSDMLVMSRKPGGVGNWTRERGNDQFDAATAVVRTPSGELYVVGRGQGELTPGDGGQARAVITKWSAAGELQWLRRWGSGTEDDPYALVRDAAGNLYAGGLTHGDLAEPNAGVQDSFVTKLDANGAALWSVQWGTSGDDWLSALALDGTGNVYAVGHTTGMLASGGGQGSDAYLVKISAAGKRVWTRQFGGSGTDAARGVGVGPDGSVYVSGYGQDLAAPGSSGAFLSKWSSDGQKLWLEQFGSADAGGYVLALDSANAIYVAGWNSNALDGAQPAGNLDVFVSKWTDNGATHPRVWSRQVGTSALDLVQAMALDPDGTIYLAGQTAGSFAGFTSQGKRDNFLLRIKP